MSGSCRFSFGSTSPWEVKSYRNAPFSWFELVNFPRKLVKQTELLEQLLRAKPASVRPDSAAPFRSTKLGYKVRAQILFPIHGKNSLLLSLIHKRISCQETHECFHFWNLLKIQEFHFSKFHLFLQRKEVFFPRCTPEESTQSIASFDLNYLQSEIAWPRRKTRNNSRAGKARRKSSSAAQKLLIPPLRLVALRWGPGSHGDDYELDDTCPSG